MGLTKNSVGIKTLDSKLEIKKKSTKDKIIAIAGNPNVGKSTIFNALTGMNQHTGNWPGKTVTNTQGYCTTKNNSYVMVDIPGTYSLMAHSTEEEIARNFICFGKNDAIIVVCDATCLERNLNLVLQIMESQPNVIVCINLMDEAKRKNIKINLREISNKLGVPVIPTIARKKKTLSKLLDTLDFKIKNKTKSNKVKIKYTKEIEEIISIIESVIRKKYKNKINTRWLSLRLLDQDESLINEINTYLNTNILNDKDIKNVLEKANKKLEEYGITKEKLKDIIVEAIVKKSEDICKDTIIYEKSKYTEIDRRIDKILTNKVTGYPIMLVLLGLVFWLTIAGANYPSEILSSILFYIQNRLLDIFNFCHAPSWLSGIVVLGAYRVLAWVVSVMLPPMAIFFPFFTLLEDLGYLPRIAYNLDKGFKKCSACGKQALTMCMGFGCNAAGIIGCRIIDSSRERLLAILTNNFVPCNGRFPMLITIITMFFVSSNLGIISYLHSAGILILLVLFCIFITFIVTKILSKTILKGIPSSFTLELPPYRKPQVGKIIIRSIFDRTIFVLGRAVVVAIPAGIIIWGMANININGISILKYCSEFLNPFANLMGLDGSILLAFILGFPANEIVIPIIIMTYMSQGSIVELDNLYEMKELFINNGWTWVTAINIMLFSLMHWPCSTTLLTIKKETRSFKWTMLAFLIPTIIGIILCMSFTMITRIFL